MTEVLSIQQELEQQPGLLLPPEAEAHLELLEMGRTDGVSAWRALGVERREGSEIEGQGLFATEDIPKNTLIAIKPGYVLSSQEVKDRASIIQGSQQQIGPNQFLAGTTPEEVDKNLVGYNHSCDPNAKVVLFKGASLAFLVTRNLVHAGDEITVDYSASQMTNTHLIEVCNCGAPDCRGIIAPLWDWEDEALQEKYAGEFVWFIQDAIDQQEKLPIPEHQIHETLKWAGMTILADNEVKRLEEQRDEALARLGIPLLQAIMRRYYDKQPAGEEIAFVQSLRLKTAARFAVTCSLSNIDDFGIERGEVIAALLTSDQGDMTEALRKTSLYAHIDEVVGFARQLDYLFNK